MSVRKFIDFIKYRSGERMPSKRYLKDVLSKGIETKASIYLDFNFRNPGNTKYGGRYNTHLLTSSRENDLIQHLTNENLLYDGCRVRFTVGNMPDNHGNTSKFFKYVSFLIDRYLMGPDEYKKKMSVTYKYKSVGAIRDVYRTNYHSYNADVDGMNLRVERFFSMLESVGVSMDNISIHYGNNNPHILVGIDISGDEISDLIDLIWCNDLELPRSIHDNYYN